jgi:UDP-N-acetylmuramoyl-tripeptide--D-alanyl-D-alanine ligase
MGMNHAGEIRDLAGIAKPRVGVVTNVGYAHVEFFDSIEGVAAAKRELIEALPRDGVAVLNADDPFVSEFRRRHRGRSILFGFSESAEVRAQRVESAGGRTRFRALGVDFETTLTGRHSILNLLAAIGAAQACGISAGRLTEPVRTFTVGKMRGERSEHNGVSIINDCYNSNPEAAKSMIDLLRATPAERRIAVLGEMLELGTKSAELHRQVGKHAAAAKIDFVIGIQGHAREIVEAAPTNAHFFDTPESAGDYVREIARPGDAILFKGSRGVRVERALERFVA